MKKLLLVIALGLISPSFGMKHYLSGYFNNDNNFTLNSQWPPNSKKRFNKTGSDQVSESQKPTLFDCYDIGMELIRNEKKDVLEGYTPSIIPCYKSLANAKIAKECEQIDNTLFTDYHYTQIVKQLESQYGSKYKEFSFKAYCEIMNYEFPDQGKKYINRLRLKYNSKED